MDSGKFRKRLTLSFILYPSSFQKIGPGKTDSHTVLTRSIDHSSEEVPVKLDAY